MNYALKFKELRKVLKVTQHEFAEQIGISRAIIAQIEMGKNNPKLETIIKVSKQYNIRSDFFFVEDADINDFFNISEYNPEENVAVIKEPIEDYSTADKEDLIKLIKQYQIKIFQLEQTNIVKDQTINKLMKLIEEK